MAIILIFKNLISVILLFLFTFCGLPNFSIAQTSTNNPTFKEPTAPTPNAAALGKYADIGVPDIFIPIYTVTDGSLSLPISVSYLKVEEMASWVGLGWALNAGGVISSVWRSL